MPTTSPQPAGARLGPEYRKLWAATAISTLGDGMYLAALPLLAAQLTRDPLAVSAVTFASWLPWLLVALLSGALVDRWDRRRVLWTGDLGRCALVGALAAVVLAGWASIWLLATAGFLLGVGQTLFDSAVLAIIPALVSRDRVRLERVNGRLGAVMTAGQQLVGQPTGGAPANLRAEIAEGLRFLLAHRVLRTLAGMVGAFALVYMAGVAILVLFAQQELGLGSVGFGLLLAALAVGGLPGNLLAAAVGQRLRAGTLLIGGVLVEAVAWLAVGLAPTAWVAPPAVNTRSVEAARVQARAAAANGPA